MREIQQKALQIKLLILDVDGVLTDGKIYFIESGAEYKAFNSKDGLGIKLLLKTGVTIGIISGRQSASVNQRLRPLGVQYIYQNQDNKLSAFAELKTKLNLTQQQIAYVGDDLTDLPILTQVGLSIAVADADDFVKQHVDWITKLPGGMGAVREVCELIMHAQNTLGDMQQQFINHA